MATGTATADCLLTRLTDNDPSLRHVELKTMKNVDYNEMSHALKRNRTVKSLKLHDGVFNLEGFRSPTWKQLRSILQSISEMKNLEELELNGNMSIDNVYDVRVIAKSVTDHPGLKRLKIQDFVVYANDHADTGPLLEPLMTAASSIRGLEDLQIQCMANYKNWDRSFLTCNVLVPFCHSTKLRRLELSNLGLVDDHLTTICKQLAANQRTVLEELILNNNNNTDQGIESLASLLGENSTIERIEVHNNKVVSDSTCEIVLKTLDQNRVIKQFRLNTPHKHRTEIEFYLLLNRAGRKVLLTPNFIPKQAVDALAAANGNVSVLMHFLRDNPTLCETSLNEPLRLESAGNNDNTLDYSECTNTFDGHFRENISSETMENFESDSVVIWRRFWYRTSTP